MQPHIILSLVANVLLTITVLYLMFSGRAIKYIQERKKLRETKRKQRRTADNARLVKLIRQEVRKYLEELAK